MTKILKIPAALQTPLLPKHLTSGLRLSVGGCACDEGGFGDGVRPRRLIWLGMRED